jgi:hypothetical protein
MQCRSTHRRVAAAAVGVVVALAAPAAAEAAGSISGRVTDEGGSPLSGICVVVATSNLSTILNTTTGPDGRYSLSNVNPGSYGAGFNRQCGPVNPAYVGEFYDDKADQGSATLFNVTDGNDTALNDAKLAAAPPPGTISGTVTAAGGGPLEGVCVMSTGPGGPGFTTTNASGHYTLTNIGGNNTVQFMGCSAGSYLSEYFDNSPTLSGATAVNAAANRTDVDAQLSPAAVISGTVSDSNGPVANVCVSLYPLASPGLTLGSSTDASGHYSFGNLSSGDYKLSFSDCFIPSSDAYAPVWADDKPTKAQADVISLASGDAVTKNASLVVGGHITGHVTGPGGAPLAGACAQADLADGTQTVSLARTDSNGDYDLQGLATGDYTVSFSGCSAGNQYATEYYDDVRDRNNAAPVSVSAPASTGGVNAELELAGQIHGTVTRDGGGPANNLCVGVYRRTTTEYLQLAGGFVAFAITDANGNYALPNLAPDSYRVVFGDCAIGPLDPNTYPSYAIEAYADRVPIAAGDDVVVTSGGDTQVNAQVALGGRVDGHLTDDQGHPVSGVCVSALDQDGDTVSEVLSGADGSYRLPGVPAGDVIVDFQNATDCRSGTAHGVLSEYFDDATSPDSATPVPVSPGQTTHNVDAVLASAATISGTITNAGGQPIVGACAGVMEPGSNSATTDASGHYAIQDLAPGTYHVRFVPCSPSNEYISEYYNDKSSLAAADPVSLTAGEQRTIDASLADAGSISGTVTENNGTPIANICVTVTASSLGFSTQRTTAADGTYSARGLEPGNYRVAFNPCNGENYIGEQYNNQPIQSPGTQIAVAAGQNRTGINASLDRGAIITGRVTNPGGSPLAGICVTATGVNSPGGGGSATTDSNGQYAINRLRSNSYKVGFRACDGSNYVNQFYNNKPTSTAANNVSASLNNTTSNIDAVMQPGATISGRITNATGDPIQGACVSASGPLGASQAAADANGDYSIVGLPAGDYRLHFDNDCVGSQGPYLPEYYDDSASTEQSTLIHLAAAEGRTGVDASLSRPGSISGTVTGPGGDPLTGICVETVSLGDGSPAYSTTTDGSGAYTLDGVRPRAYKLEFRDCDHLGPYATEYWNDRASAAAADPITVGDGEAVTGKSAQLALDPRPETTIQTGPSGTGNQTDVAFAFGSDEVDATFECSLDGASFSSCVTPAQLTGLADGVHTFAVRAIDSVGQADASPASRTWTVDTSSPNQTTSGTVEAGTTVTTDPGNNGATATAPLMTALTTPNQGDVSITAGPSGSPPSGYDLIGQQVVISAPPATVADPLRLVFRIDGTAIPPGTQIGDVVVLRNGSPAGAACAGDGTARPDPCVDSRQVVGDDFELTVLTSHASTWNLASVAIQDADGDGVPDSTDNCRTTANATQADADQDHIGDACDPDRDGDGKANGADNCADVPNANQLNTDHDALGNACDPDDDNDGVADGADSCATGNTGWTSNATTDSDHDGCRDSTEDSDDDNDGVADAADNCKTTPNANQSDIDRDRIGDVCDSDRDGDGKANGADNCADVANANQADADHDHIGDVCDPDRDGDGVANTTDNCADVANATQADYDSNGKGDACDPVTPTGLCKLTKSYVQGSAAYARLSAPAKAVVDRLATALCDVVGPWTAKMSAAKKTALVNAYRSGVTALVAPGWLTTAQATNLKNAAGALLP